MKKIITAYILPTGILMSLGMLVFLMSIPDPENKFKKGQRLIISDELVATVTHEPSYLAIRKYRIKYFDKNGVLQNEELKEFELTSLTNKP